VAAKTGAVGHFVPDCPLNSGAKKAGNAPAALGTFVVPPASGGEAAMGERLTLPLTPCQPQPTKQHGTSSAVIWSRLCVTASEMKHSFDAEQKAAESPQSCCL
jgi:hypothetical protein